jgi:predicted aspartyl protease
MVIPGRWWLCRDGILRPVLEGRVLCANGAWRGVVLLVDTGADRTVLTADVLEDLGQTPAAPDEQLAGAGGLFESVLVKTSVRMDRQDGGSVTVQGTFAAFRDRNVLDMSVLGRDILDIFPVIVDRPRNFVCLIGQGHKYVIQAV